MWIVYKNTDTLFDLADLNKNHTKFLYSWSGEISSKRNLYFPSENENRFSITFSLQT